MCVDVLFHVMEYVGFNPYCLPVPSVYNVLAMMESEHQTLSVPRSVHVGDKILAFNSENQREGLFENKQKRWKFSMKNQQ